PGRAMIFRPAPLTRAACYPGSILPLRQRMITRSETDDKNYSESNPQKHGKHCCCNQEPILVTVHFALTSRPVTGQGVMGCRARRSSAAWASRVSRARV